MFSRLACELGVRVKLFHHRVSHRLLSSTHASQLGLCRILIDALLDLAQLLVERSAVAFSVET